MRMTGSSVDGGSLFKPPHGGPEDRVGVWDFWESGTGSRSESLGHSLSLDGSRSTIDLIHNLPYC